MPYSIMLYSYIKIFFICHRSHNISWNPFHLLQHESFKIVSEHCLFHCIKNVFNIPGVNCSCKMMKYGFCVISLLDEEQIQNKASHIGQICWVTVEFWHITSDLICIWPFLLKKISIIEHINFFLNCLFHSYLEVFANIDTFIFHFFLQQIHFVQEKNERNRPENSVVDNCIENISRFLQPICTTVFE